MRLSLARPSPAPWLAPVRSAAVLTLVSLLASALACGGESATSPAGVTDVVVTGVPQTTVLVGDTVRLVATAVNASGGVVSNQRVTWRSSAPTIAAVSDGGRVIALGGGRATITATVGGHHLR
jgi:hypothetical protein